MTIAPRSQRIAPGEHRNSSGQSAEHDAQAEIQQILPRHYQSDDLPDGVEICALLGVSSTGIGVVAMNAAIAEARVVSRTDKTLPDARTVIAFREPYRAGGGNNPANDRRRMGSVFWSCQHVIDVMVWIFRRRGDLAGFVVEAARPLGSSAARKQPVVSRPQKGLCQSLAPERLKKQFPPTPIRIGNSYVTSMNALR